MNEYTISLTPAAKSDLTHVINCFHSMYRTKIDVVMNSFIESCNTIKCFPETCGLSMDEYRVLENRDLDTSLIYKIEEAQHKIIIQAVVLNNADPRRWSNRP